MKMLKTTLSYHVYPMRTTEQQPTSCSTSQEQSVMKGAATLNVKDDQSKESVKEDS